MKLSSSKLLLPGQKQVFRLIDHGRMVRDVLARQEETLPGEALLQPVMRHGQRLAASRVPVDLVRQHVSAQLALLPLELKRLDAVQTPYTVDISEALRTATAQLQRQLERTGGPLPSP
jgi:nicotinate phosphoribosyltransferase